MRFYKYHAAGNDFIITDDLAVTSADAPHLCNRSTGIGADGILLCRPSTRGEARMVVINADGSIAAMCGNGLRCFCRYLVEQCGIGKENFHVETDAGLYSCSVRRDNDGWYITVDLGTAVVCDEPFPSRWRVAIGNNHLVALGPSDEREARETALRLKEEYGGKLNVEVVRSIDHLRRVIELVVNERGVGFTAACGTGGAAVTAALHHAGVLGMGEEWALWFPGGALCYRIDGEGRILMTGDAVFVFSGDTDVPAH